MRAAGILLPIFSLPDKYGIGGFSKKAYEFVDFLKAAGQKYWQILPLGPTGYGDSPYQSYSTFAGNPYFISIETLLEEGLLTAKECARYSAFDGEYINYEKLNETRLPLLRLAYKRVDLKKASGYSSFAKKNKFWLEDYALFMALKDYYGGKSFTQWDEELRKRDAKALNKFKKQLEEDINFYKFLQFEFSKQWFALKKYANKNGIGIVGDIPIYVAFDSSDVWANPELFDLNRDLLPNAVAGCPPDPFAATGQLWGNPLYNWKYHKETGFEWWLKRIGYCFELYDVVRIDHFRGFDEYYAIPYGDPTAEFGKWKKGPGYSLFKAIRDELGEKKIIAEDLGFLTDSVRELVKKTGFPGMKVLLFAFDSDNRSEYLPHMITKNTTIYTGTHDNETVRGWYNRVAKEDKRTKKYFDEYTGCKDESEAADCMIKLAMASVSDTAIISLFDYLNKGNEARVNTPSVLGGNWNKKLMDYGGFKELAKKVNKLTDTYGRNI